MKTFSEHKKSFNTQLSMWEARISTLQSSIENKFEIEHFNDKREKLISTISQIDEKLVNLSKEKKNRILEKRDTLNLQLALGKAELKTNYKQNKKEISDAIRDYEAQLVSDLEIEDALLEQAWIEDSIVFEEAMEALALELAKEDELLNEILEQKKQEMKDSLSSFKLKVEEKNKKFKEGIKESIEEVANEYAKLGQYYNWK